MAYGQRGGIDFIALTRPLPWLLLLIATTVGALERVVPLQVSGVEPVLTAQVVGAAPSRSVQKAAQVLVFDSYTGAANYAVASNSPRTFMGMVANLDAAAGNDPLISRVVVFMGYTGVAAQNYSRLGVRFKLWNNWSSLSTPVFSNPPDLQIAAEIPGPITLNPGSMTPIGVNLDPPLPLSGLLKHGIAINFQGDTGSGLVITDLLTPVLRYGPNPIAVGANQIATGFGYRNSSGRTDFNFAPGESETIAQSNQALALQLYAVPTPSAGPLVQDGGFEAGLVPTYWAQNSSNYGSPICDASCGAAPPRTGSKFVWFGGAETAAEIGSVQQRGVIDAGPATLNFYVWWFTPLVSPPDPNATFKVKIDDNTIFTLTPATAAAYNNAYTLVSLDISAYADGNPHTLRFESSNAAAPSSTNILIDDISIVRALVKDGGFEAGFVPTYWTQTSTQFGTPLCDTNCGSAAPRTGSYFSWFGGGIGGAAEAASVQQSGVILEGPKKLEFYAWWYTSVVSPPDPNAYFRAKIDGNTIFTLTPATASAYSTAYTRASVDISAYADGQSHTLRFESNNVDSPGPTYILLDDISIIDDRIFTNGFDT